MFQHKMIDIRKRISKEDDDDEGFSLKDTTKVMEYITESTDVFKSSSLLGKRRREDYKSNVECCSLAEILSNSDYEKIVKRC